MRLRIPDHVVSKDLEDDLILVNLESGFCFSLEGAGVDIWRMLAQGAAVADIVASVADRYGVDRERVAADADALIASLSDHRLVEHEP